MKEYLKKYGVRMGIVVAASAFLILVGAAARSGIGFVQNLTGIVAAPMQKVLSSTVNWFNSIYGYLYEYDALMAENESLRMQLAEAQQSAREGIEASEENVRLREALELRQKHTDYVIRPPAGAAVSAAEAHGLCAGIRQGGALVLLQLVQLLHHQQGQDQRH